MSKKNQDLQKVTLNLREGDWEYMTSILAPSGVHTSTFVRLLVSRRVDELRGLEAANSAPAKMDILPHD